VLILAALPAYVLLYSQLHSNRPKAVRVAVNVESMVDKYGILTLVVLGESLMALLFEGSELLSVGDVHVASLFRGVFLGVLIVYSLMTLYFNVDNVHLKGSVHPIRHNRWAGLLWAMVHVFYHMTLAGFLSTGIGLMLRDIAVPPGKAGAEGTSVVEEAAAHVLSAVARASEASNAGKAHFDSKARWLFSGAWLAAILLSSFMGLLHKPGPRGRTKNLRILIRVFIALALGIGMPFARLSASANLYIFAAATVLFAVSEFILIEADSIGMLSRTGAPVSSTSGSTHVEGDTSDDMSDASDEMDPADDREAAKAGIAEEDAGLDEVDTKTAVLRRAAVCRGREHRLRFEAVSHPVLSLRNATAHHP
jgi:hypothetical protein